MNAAAGRLSHGGYDKPIDVTVYPSVCFQLQGLVAQRVSGQQRVANFEHQPRFFRWYWAGMNAERIGKEA